MVKPKKVLETRGRRGLSGQHGTGERSPFVGIRLAEAELEAIDALAERECVKRSEMIRRLLAVGIRAITKG